LSLKLVSRSWKKFVFPGKSTRIPWKFKEKSGIFGQEKSGNPVLFVAGIFTKTHDPFYILISKITLNVLH